MPVFTGCYDFACANICAKPCAKQSKLDDEISQSRGGWYRFERVAPPDARHLIEQKEWRHTIATDSKVEAETRCRRRTVETDEQLRQARSGTYRGLSQMEIEDLAAQ